MGRTPGSRVTTEPPELRALAADPTVTQEAAGRCLGMTPAQVRYRLRRFGVVWRRANRAADRNDRIRRLHEQGLSQTAIARMCGLSRQRIWQIIHGR